MVVVFTSLSGGFGEEGLHFTLYEWIPAGTFRVPFSLAVDNLTAVLLIVVTTVGMLVHVYSVGYMAHDGGRWRFFAYLNLFMFSMLLLVLAANFLLLFAAWELVGLSSYLLIGFWYPRRSASVAAKKAFLVNRVGDVGFALGIMAVWTTVGTLEFKQVFELLPAAVPRRRDRALDDGRHRPAALLRRRGQERPVPAPRLAARRDGGPDPGLRPHPRRDHGQRRRLLRGPRQPHLQPLAGGHVHGRRDRHLHGHPGRLDRPDPEGHQTRAGVFHAQPARLHVRRARRRGLHRGHLPPHDPRLLQGPAVPWLRLGHPRRPRGAGHGQDGRPVAEDPDHPLDDAHRRPGHRRHPAPGRLLQQGRGPGRHLRAGLLRHLG